MNIFFLLILCYLIILTYVKFKIRPHPKNFIDSAYTVDKLDQTLTRKNMSHFYLYKDEIFYFRNYYLILYIIYN